MESRAIHVSRALLPLYFFFMIFTLFVVNNRTNG